MRFPPTLAFLAAAALAQANPQWQPIGTVPGPLGTVYDATWWDPDGPGPATALLVCVGSFSSLTLGIHNLATFDPATGTWAGFAEQPMHGVNSVDVTPSGDLVIGGSFSAIGATSAVGVARWDGSTWSAVGGGVTPGFVVAVRAVLALPNGDIVVGGAFNGAGNVTTGLARWDGNQWHALGSFLGHVNAIARRPNGNLVVVGRFNVPAGTGVANVGEWDGTTWSTFGSGVGTATQQVDDVHVMSNGDIIVTGSFTIAGGVTVDQVAWWNGTAWAPLPNFHGAPRAFLNLPNGDLLAASAQTINNVPVDGVVRWDGSQWTSYAPHIGQLYDLLLAPNGDLIGAGGPNDPTLVTFRGFARWDGAAWHNFGTGFDGDVTGLVALPNNELLAWGDFWSAGGTDARFMARWNGAAWSPWTGSNRPTTAAVDPTDVLWIAASAYNQYSGPALQRWTSTGWQPFGSWIAGVQCLDVTDPLHPVVGTGSHGPSYGSTVARWTGSVWAALGVQPDGPVHVLLRHSSGDLIAGGEFLFAGTTGLSRIARYDGTAWQPLGLGLDGPVHALAELQSGDIVAGGHFFRDGLGVQPLHLVARWDGSAWHAMGSGLLGSTTAQVNAFVTLPGGDLIAGGSFTRSGTAAVENVARWNGTSWSPIDGGTDREVMALARMADGTVVAGGRFTQASGEHSTHFAPLVTDLPATATYYGQPCAGLGGMLALEADTLPWLGGTFASTCYGVSPTAIVADVYGLQAAQLSLQTVHPTAGAGCQLLTMPAATMLRLPTLGAVHSSLALPSTPAVVGVTLFEQMIVGEIGGGTLNQLSSSNGLRLTVGAF